MLCSFLDLTYAVEGQRFINRLLSSCVTAAEVAPSPMVYVALSVSWRAYFAFGECIFARDWSPALLRPYWRACVHIFFVLTVRSMLHVRLASIQASSSPFVSCLDAATSVVGPHFLDVSG